jgi:CAAX protease family protein
VRLIAVSSIKERKSCVFLELWLQFQFPIIRFGAHRLLRKSFQTCFHSSVDFSALPWDFILILLVLAVAIPWRGVIRIRRLLAQPSITSSQRLSLYTSTILFQWGLAGIVFWRGSSRHLTLNELGLVLPGVWRTGLIALMLTAILCLNQWAGLKKIEIKGVDRSSLLFRFREKIMPHSALETVVFTGLACTAGLAEELVYRGFVFALCASAFSPSAHPALLAMIVSSAWFAIAHLYQGRRGIITTYVVGMLFSAVRFWSGSLLPVMIAHAGIDLIAGLSLPKIGLSQPKSAGGEEDRART